MFGIKFKKNSETRLVFLLSNSGIVCLHEPDYNYITHETVNYSYCEKIDYDYSRISVHQPNVVFQKLYSTVKSQLNPTVRLAVTYIYSHI